MDADELQQALVERYLTMFPEWRVLPISASRACVSPRDIVARHEWDEPMSRRPIGEAAMSDAERARRRRAKAKSSRHCSGEDRPDRHGAVAVTANGAGEGRLSVHQDHRRTDRREVLPNSKSR